MEIRLCLAYLTNRLILNGLPGNISEWVLFNVTIHEHNRNIPTLSVPTVICKVLRPGVIIIFWSDFIARIFT